VKQGKCEGAKLYGAREGEIEVVEKIKQLHAIGKNYSQIAAELNATGVKTRIGRLWYRTHVLGDRTAALGTGKRYLIWLQRNHPREYREAAGVNGATGGFCENPICSRGESGQPATLTHLRAGARFCSDLCRQQSKRAA